MHLKPVDADSHHLGDEGTTGEEPKTLNSMKALWSRSAKEIIEAEYHEFYQQIAHDWTDPLETIHVRSEGTFAYEALLFLPARAPFDLYTSTREAECGVHLYVNRVFIMVSAAT